MYIAYIYNLAKHNLYINTLLIRKQKNLLYLSLLCSSLIFFSCRKNDSEIPKPEQSFSIERFFGLASADGRLKEIAQSIRKQENEHPFLKDFIKRAGWPVWEKSKILGPGNVRSGRWVHIGKSL